MNKKIVFLPYDFDTAIGINNEGALVFSYNLEDIDQTEGGADVFNAQQSVLWKNMRAAFFDEMKAMYQNLRSTGALSYEKVEQMFEEHQGKWPEAIFNEDAWFKYLAPLVEKGNASYLSMLQGSKAEQRKWWLYNRFRYIDSKYNAGDALTDVITLRGYAKADITVQPYADVYATIKYGSYLVQSRSARSTQTTLPCPVDNVNDTEIYIYSASQLASVGDLSGLMVGYADFSKATKLQSLKIGDGSANYSNGNLKELYLGNNELLRSIDVRNCPALAQAVNISGCSNVEHVYFDGTSITGLALPNGGILKTLHVPSTLANLTIMNQPSLMDFSLPSAENVTTLRLENIGESVDTKSIIVSLKPGSRVRVIGFKWVIESASILQELINVLDTMRGLDESGGNAEKAQMSGVVSVADMTGAVLLDVHAKYPDITVEYQNLSSKCYFRNFDGTEVLYTAESLNGSDVTYEGETPEKPSSVSHTFKFTGWTKLIGSNETDSDALKNVVEDRTLYPVFTSAIRTYSVRFYSGSTLLQEFTEVPYNTSVSYSGEIPTKTDTSNPSNYEFIGWDIEAINVQSDLDIHAQFNYTGYLYKDILSGSLEGVYENNRLTEIGDHAFDGMDLVEEINLPALMNVPAYAFNNCDNVSRISIPKVSVIEDNAFNNCVKLSEVVASEITSVGSSGFGNCSNLQVINLSNTITIKSRGLSGCTSLKSLNLPHVVTIQSYALQSCTGLVTVNLGDSLTTIGDYVFSGCSSLETVSLPATVRRIENGTFKDCTKLKNVIFNGKPYFIGSSAFTGDDALTDIYVSWEEGQLSGAPWGATNAVIHYIDEEWKGEI